MRSGSAMVIFALFLAEISATFESAMLYIALPTLIREFGDPITAGWLITVHMLIGAAAAVLAGRLGDIMGRKRVMLILLAVSAAGSVMSALTSDFAIVLAGRALQGTALAVLPLTIGILRESLPNGRLPVAVGLMTTAQGAGVALGLVLGGAIVDNFNWHWLFVASAILLGVSWMAVRLLIPARPGTRPREPIDWLEGLLPAPGIMAVLLGISMSKSAGWSAPSVWGSILVGAMVLAVWARRSLRASEPFIDLRMLGTRNVALANIITILLAMGTMQINFVFATYIQSPTWTLVGLGLSATVAGLSKLPSNVLSFFAGPLSGYLTQTFGNRVPVVAGALLAFAGWIVGMRLPGSLVEVILLLCVISFGTAILNAAIPNVIVSSVPQERTSEAIGTMSVVRGLSAAVGIQVIAVMLATDTIAAATGDVELPSGAGFRLTMGWIAALTLATAACGFLLRSRMSAQTGTAAGVEVAG